ncbi:MAG TPA: orotidine-5'-phosphate decarboxylase [Candidatus Kapabacteria bacterium]|jgi:orotidine-5'-phosphate decarboxylase|nr:orotidine-5'-phosphate decarboxylase [Candidatus Kapabacteria bacterium]HPP40160.1 orotidine-5'-phosphate decarboxylase [Candidatus Kapabacteria bacterium]HPU23357.1 orotidine-5'-phosphate decarboxylase [Candidatus Kapabacteria bacterium]
MAAFQKIIDLIKEKKTLLCVGLDTDLEKIPDGFPKNSSGLNEFNKAIIDATKDLAIAYKINFAFYEQYGVPGFKALNDTFKAIPPSHFVIADAKRGDIGNTSMAYARSIFDYFNADSITVNPYMGYDSLSPFFNYRDKIIFILALTSNQGAFDYQKQKINNEELYKLVIKKTSVSYNFEQTGYVVGATHPDEIREVRKLVPRHLLLIPGVGAQGGDIKSVLKANGNSPAIVNVSRAIIYPDGDGDYFERVRNKAEYYSKALQILQ